MKRLSCIWITSLILLVVLSACGGGGEAEQASPDAGSGSKATATSALPTQASEQATEPAPVEPTEAAVEDAGEPPAPENLLDLGSLETNPEELSGGPLQSYRLRAEWTVEPKPGSDEEASSFGIEVAHTTDPLAEQMTFSGEEEAASSMIRIGDQLWFQAGEDWIEVSSDDTAGSWDEMLFSLDSATAGLTGDARLVGEENLNGVDTRHYAFDDSILGGIMGSYNTIKGDIWVAVEGDYVVRYVFTAEDEKANYHWNWEVYDINAPFAIEPPADAQGAREDIPLMADAAERTTFGGMVTYKTASDLQAVMDFYKEQMPAQGWTYDESASMIMDQLAMLYFDKGGERATVTISPEDGGGATVMIQAGE